MKYNEKNIVIKKLVRISVMILVILFVSYIDKSKAIEVAKYSISDTIKIVENKKPKSKRGRKPKAHHVTDKAVKMKHS